MDRDLMLRAVEASHRITRRAGWADASMSRMFIRRAYSLERARNKRLRAELEAYKDFSGHHEFCMHAGGSIAPDEGCSCGFKELRERFA